MSDRDFHDCEKKRLQAASRPLVTVRNFYRCRRRLFPQVVILSFLGIGVVLTAGWTYALSYAFFKAIARLLF
jgi:hypothetical protein